MPDCPTFFQPLTKQNKCFMFIIKHGKAFCLTALFFYHAILSFAHEPSLLRTHEHPSINNHQSKILNRPSPDFKFAAGTLTSLSLVFYRRIIVPPLFRGSIPCLFFYPPQILFPWPLPCSLLPLPSCAACPRTSGIVHSVVRIPNSSCIRFSKTNTILNFALVILHFKITFPPARICSSVVPRNDYPPRKRISPLEITCEFPNAPSLLAILSYNMPPAAICKPASLPRCLPAYSLLGLHLVS